MLLLSSIPVQANSVDQWQSEIKEIKEERTSLKEKIQETKGKDQLELIMQESELAGFQKAYELAIDYINGNLDKVSFYKNQNILIDHGIPNEYIPIYQEAGEKYNVEWFLLAAIHKTETNFSTLPSMVSSAGAIGHMQFMPLTWEAYGVDGNKDGKTDPWNLKDSVYSAANYLAANGAAAGDLEKAVFAYNHANWYVKDVLSLTDTYKKSFSYSGIEVIEVSKRFINNSVYVFGGGRNVTDIENGIFDCSSFVHWAFSQVGKDLGNRTSVTTDTLKVQGNSVSVNDMQQGDLVFFDTYKKDGHVGIYIGNGKFIGAQSTTGVAIADMSKGYWKEKFNGRVKRL